MGEWRCGMTGVHCCCLQLEEVAGNPVKPAVWLTSTRKAIWKRPNMQEWAEQKIPPSTTTFLLSISTAMTLRKKSKKTLPSRLHRIDLCSSLSLSNWTKNISLFLYGCDHLYCKKVCHDPESSTDMSDAFICPNLFV